MLKNRFQTRKPENPKIFGFSPPTYLTLMPPELFSVITYGPLALHVPRYIPYQCFDKGVLESDYCSQRYCRLKGSKIISIRAVDSGRQTAGRGRILLAFMETISTSHMLNLSECSKIDFKLENARNQGFSIFTADIPDLDLTRTFFCDHVRTSRFACTKIHTLSMFWRKGIGCRLL